MGFIERHVTDKAKTVVHAFFGIVTLILGHTPSLLSLGHVIEYKGMVPFFDAHDVMDVMSVQHLDMRGIGTATVFGDHHLEIGGSLTELGDEAFGRMALTVIRGGPIGLADRFRHQGHDLALVGMDQRRPQHLMGIRHSAGSVMCCSTRRTVNLLGRKVAGAIESQEGVAWDKFHLFEDLAPVEFIEDVLEHGA